jgi:pimeloyl-ACP methyl ester carboxylesterase
VTDVSASPFDSDHCEDRRADDLMVSVGDEMVHVRDEGPKRGQTIVLVHGFLGSTHWFDRLAPLLAEDFRVIRTDLIGHGASSDIEGGYSPDAQGRVLTRVLDYLGVTGGTLLGHSLGADVAIAAIENGAIVDYLVVVNEGPDYTTFNRNPINALLRAPLIGPTLYRGLSAAAIRAAVARFFAPGFPMVTAFDAPLQPVSYARSASSTLRYQAVDTATVETIADAGHSPILENPERTASSPPPTAVAFA